MKLPILQALCGLSPLMTLSAAPLNYPEARQDSTTEVLHGVTIPDPWRWMEDLDSRETTAYTAAQAQLTESFLEKLPRRTALLERLKQLQDYDKHGMPALVAGRLFYSLKKGLQGQAVYFWQEDQPGATPRVLLDPNTLSPDGTTALSGMDIRDDGKYVAYGLSEAGSDWERWKIRDVETGTDLPDDLQWIKFSGGSWSKKGDGFYYSRYAAPEKGQELKEQNLNQKLYFHRMGDPQEKDTLIYERPDHPKWSIGAGETEDGKFLLIHISQGTRDENAVFYRDLQAGAQFPVVELLRDFDADYRFVGNHGRIFYFLTTHKAPNKRLVALNLDQPAPEHWKTIIPESPNVITSVSLKQDRWIVERMTDAHDRITVHDAEGKQTGEIAVPNFGSAGGFGGKQTDAETFYMVTGFDTPGTIYRYQVASGTSSVHRRTEMDFNEESVEVSQEFFTSRDGTRVPLYLCRKKGTPRDGNNPVLLYGYGGFNISLTPSFSPSRLAWLEMGGVYAQVNLRGGGEYGQAWHEAGMKERKQNVFDDCIAAAEFLVREQWTKPSRLALMGGSNGGLLVGAVINQRPDLFACAIPQVGVMDMLRFHKFTIGWAWQEEYGSPDNPTEFPVLRAYSPLHNIRPMAYPATMIMTGDHDDRVFPAHSFKYAAALQRAQTGPAPILLRVDLRAGHGAGKPTLKALEETADAYAFMAQALGMDPAEKAKAE